MSWASIVKKTPNQHKSTSIKVKYSVNSASNKQTKTDDDIPRHKEIIADISDDFLMTNEANETRIQIVSPDWKPSNWNGQWVNFEEFKQLKAHKESLPLSIQRIIEFAQQRIGHNKVIKLNYKEIEQDLKHQYQICNGDSKKLKKLYFNIPKKLLGAKKFEIPFNLMYFNFQSKKSIKLKESTSFEGFKNYTLVHYLIHEIVFGNLVPNDPVLVLLTLLIKNSIINCNDSIHCTIWDGGEYSLYDMILYGAIQSKRSDQVTKNVDNFVDLIVSCIKQQNTEALVEIRINNNLPALSHYLLDQWVGWMNFSYDPDNYHICNETEIIERLLFKGVLPFQCITEETLPLNKTKQCLDNLFDVFKIYENIKDKESVVNRRNFPKNQMALTSPLVILPHLNKAKKWMCDILMGYICKEIANVICEYLYMNYDIFFNKKFQNNLNVQSMIFFTHLAHFGMDKLFLQNFYTIYNNEAFVNYLVDNYLFTISCVLNELLLVDFEVIISLIQIYNGSNKDKKFPLNEKSYGIYTILKFLMQHSSFDKHYQSFIKLLAYVKTAYKNEFDINYRYQFSYDGEGEFRPRFKSWGPETFLTILLRKSSISDTKLKVAKFILTEFKSKDDVLIEFKNLKNRAKSF